MQATVHEPVLYQILSSCRVPGPKQDLVTKFSRTKKPPMHITVVHNY